MMNEKRTTDKTLDCQIHIKGQLPATWSAWLGGLNIQNSPSGEALLDGRLPDQSALFGVIERLRDLGIELIGMSCWLSDASSEPR